MLSLKKPEARPWKNLSSYLQKHHCEMSQSDAEFIPERYNSDCVALSTDEKELMSMFLEKHLFWLFKSKVGFPKPFPSLCEKRILTMLPGGYGAGKAEPHELLF